MPARDHQAYDRAWIDRAFERCSGADVLLMTRKDWVKASNLIDSSARPVPVAVPDLEIEFIDGEAALRRRLLDTVARD